ETFVGTSDAIMRTSFGKPRKRSGPHGSAPPPVRSGSRPRLSEKQNHFWKFPCQACISAALHGTFLSRRSRTKAWTASADGASPDFLTANTPLLNHPRAGEPKVVGTR